MRLDRNQKREELKFKLENFLKENPEHPNQMTDKVLNDGWEIQNEINCLEPLISDK